MKKRKIKKVGDKCRHCDTLVIFKASKFKQSKLKKPYYFRGYLKCETCRAIYMLEKFKVYNVNIPKRKKKKKKKKVVKTRSLKELRTMSYEKYLNTGHWRRRRLEYYKTHKKICFCCGCKSYALHHISYKNRGNEKDEDLTPLCEKHHNKIHDDLIGEEGVTLENAHEVLRDLINLGDTF